MKVGSFAAFVVRGSAVQFAEMDTRNAMKRAVPIGAQNQAVTRPSKVKVQLGNMRNWSDASIRLLGFSNFFYRFMRKHISAPTVVMSHLANRISPFSKKFCRADKSNRKI